MCGIIAYIAKDNKSTEVGKAILNQYQDQLGRGQKGFGLIEVFQNHINIERAVEPTKALIDVRLSQAPIQIFHHRFPTSTENTMRQTHPFMISHDELDYDYCVIHNGVIRNANPLMEKHTEELGYVYQTLEKQTNNYSLTNHKFNDSEALSIEVARVFDGQTGMIHAEGTIAFIAIRLEKATGKPLKMIWGRNEGNPLECLETDKGMLLASTIYHTDAEAIREKSFEEFDIQKYFKSKAKSYGVYEAVESGDLEFYVKPPAPIVTHSPVVHSHVGFGRQSAVESKTVTKTSTTSSSDADQEIEEQIERDNYADRGRYSTPREVAFDKMAERVSNDIAEDIAIFFADLAYSEADEADVNQLVNRFSNMLAEKVESASEKVRPFFDYQEEKETDRIMSDEVMPHVNYLDEEDEESYPTLNDRIDASAKRFHDITS